MSEMLTYAPDLRALTGGQGDYTMEFLRYEEIPAHLAQKVVDAATRGGRGRQGLSREQRERARAMRPRVAPLLPSAAVAARKSISTNAPVVNCDVCGRTLLPGEHPTCSSPRGEKRNVCELCTQRASHEGWIREGLDDATVRAAARTSGRSRGAARAPARPPRAAPTTRPTSDAQPDHHPPAPPRARARAAPPPRPPREQRNVHAIPTNADLKMARALDLFNGSSHPRTVAGVARSLGAPIVAVRPSLTEGSVVTIVVGWELSWYRFEVDLGDEAAGVRLVEPGDRAVRARAGRPDAQRRGRRAGRVAPRRAARIDFRAGDLLRHPRGTRAGALRAARRVLQGRPEREGHHRPPQERAARADRAASTAEQRTVPRPPPARASPASSRRSTPRE